METEQDDEKDRSLFNTPLSPFGLYGIGDLPYTRLIQPRPYIYNSPLLNMVNEPRFSNKLFRRVRNYNGD